MQEPWRNWWFSFWTIYNSRYVRLLFFCSLVPFKKQLKIVHFFAKEKKNQKTNSRHSLFTLSTPPFVWYNAHVRVLHFCHFVCDFFFGFRYYFFFVRFVQYYIRENTSPCVYIHTCMTWSSLYKRTNVYQRVYENTYTVTKKKTGWSRLEIETRVSLTAIIVCVYI